MQFSSGVTDRNHLKHTGGVIYLNIVLIAACLSQTPFSYHAVLKCKYIQWMLIILDCTVTGVVASPLWLIIVKYPLTVKHVALHWTDVLLLLNVSVNVIPVDELFFVYGGTK